MPSKRNKKTKILTKSRNFREKKAQATIDNESDGSFSDEEYQPEPLGAAHIPRDYDSDPEELPRRNKFEVFPLDVGDSDEERATRSRPLAKRGNRDSKPAQKSRTATTTRASAARRSSSGEEEQLAFDDDTDSDVDDNAPTISSSDYKKMKRTYESLAEEQRREKHKEELASDLEIAASDDEETNTPAADERWGHKRSKYYGADLDKRSDLYRYQRRTTATDALAAEGDEELDEMALEEAEALATQRRLAALIDEDDLALAAPTDTNEELKGERHRQGQSAGVHTISSDRSSLTKADQIRLLKRDSPELLGLARELRQTLRVLDRRWRPLRRLLADARVGPVARKALTPFALSLVSTAFRLHAVYALNITTYFLMKLRQNSVKEHPVISRILQYRKLLDKLSPHIEQNGKLFDRLLKQLPTIATKYDALSAEERKAIDDATEACVAEAGEAQEQDSAAESASAEESVDEDEDDDIESENDAEEDEEEVGGGGGRRKRVDPSESRERKEKVSSTSSVAADAGGKRKINYLMEKNPGLKPKRPKKQRNPRVKHRLAYQRALLRNRTRDRAHSRPQQEPTRYTGERFGMRAGLVRSRRLV